MQAPGTQAPKAQMDIKTFKEEAARLRKEFDLKIKNILDEIRLRKMEELKKDF